MKKFIQICSILTVLAAFTVVASANVETAFGTEVNIPFAFNVGDQSYDAGSYIVKVSRLSSGSATLSIQDTKTDAVQIVLLNVNNYGSGEDMNLVFDTIEGRKYLSKIRTADKTFALVKVRSEKNARKAIQAASIGGSASELL